MKKLNPNDKELLVEILKKRYPSILSASADFEFDGLTSLQVQEICQALTDEFCETGLLPDSEPNERGLRLEALIDHFR